MKAMEPGMVLTAIAVVCFALAALIKGEPRVKLGWAGAAIWALADIV